MTLNYFFPCKDTHSHKQEGMVIRYWCIRLEGIVVQWQKKKIASDLDMDLNLWYII